MTPKSSHTDITPDPGDVLRATATLACPHPESCPLGEARDDSQGPAFCPLRACGRCVPVAETMDQNSIDRSAEPIGWIDL
jgi:hypothetical protein